MNQNDEKSISTMLLRLSTELRWNKKLRISKKFPKSLKDLIDPTYIAPAYTKKMEFIQRFYRKYEKSANYSGELEGDEKLEEEEGGRKEEELERFLYLFTPDQVIEFCRYLISDHYSIFVNRKSVLTIGAIPMCLSMFGVCPCAGHCVFLVVSLCGGGSTTTSA